MILPRIPIETLLAMPPKIYSRISLEMSLRVSADSLFFRNFCWDFPWIFQAFSAVIFTVIALGSSLSIPRRFPEGIA